MGNSTESEEVCLLMFSGGYDTLLAPCYAVEKGYKVLLITYDNGMEMNLDSATKNAERLTSVYGNKIEFLGVRSIVGIWRRLFLIPYLLGREKFEYNLVPMEMMCLSCRTSMYIRSIVECLQRNVRCLVEGARESQMYPEQQRPVVNVFQEMCKTYSIELYLPVYEVKDKEQLKEELVMRSIIPKTTEPYCAFAMPLYEYAPLEKRVQEMENFLREYLKPKAEQIIDKWRGLLQATSRKEEVLV